VRTEVTVRGRWPTVFCQITLGVYRRGLTDSQHRLSLLTVMSAALVRRPSPSPYERSPLSRLPVEVSRFLVSGDISLAYVFICSAKTAYIRDPTIRAVRALSICLQVPPRGVQTIPTLLSRSLHHRETRPGCSHKSERAHRRTPIPDVHPGHRRGFVPTTGVPCV